ncbi:hypothetical protein [Haloarcula sp. Atlit-120R]|uniref:hypothetical protein n=1 Tax=Haloarcula sp. Atlit-120R TaxID=2282135 RepID=UPI000EF28973|nr:hypothetical protein [Haloarcula sp. Atlit-120R]RLM37218.1 hypothetical protein DVK01_11505 [Haloarcula sp. Atlit-120R]
MVLDNILDLDLRNVSLDEAALSVVFTISALAQFGAATISLSLFTDLSMSEVMFTFLGGNVTLAFLLGGGVFGYNLITTGFTLSDFKRLPTVEQFFLASGAILMFTTPFIGEVSAFVTGADWQTAVSLVDAALAYGVVANYGDEE